jgi:hypothetical protein
MPSRVLGVTRVDTPTRRGAVRTDALRDHQIPVAQERRSTRRSGGSVASTELHTQGGLETNWALVALLTLDVLAWAAIIGGLWWLAS